MRTETIQSCLIYSIKSHYGDLILMWVWLGADLLSMRVLSLVDAAGASGVRTLRIRTKNLIRFVHFQCRNA